jgi:flagellin-like hook-associated protein FlgL
MTFNTGIYMNTAGFWTDSAAIASAFSLEELRYSIAGTSANYTATATIGGTGVSMTGTNFASPVAAVGLSSLGQLITTNIQNILSPATGGRISGGQTGMTAPTPAQIAAVPPAMSTLMTRYTGTTGKAGNLDVSTNIAGFITGYNPLVTANVGALATGLTTDIATLLSSAQTLASTAGLNGMGRLAKEPPAPHSGPATEAQVPDLATNEIYKSAATQQTVTSTGIVDKTKFVTLVASAGTDYYDASGHSNFGAWALASAINHNPNSQFWAMVQTVDSNGVSADMVYVFTKKGGDFNNLLACDVADGDIASQDALQAISFENVSSTRHNQSGTNFTLGGENWGTFKPIQTKAGQGKEVWNLTLHGRDVGSERDLWIAALANGNNEVITPGLNAGIINGLDRYSFVEIQNADDGPWKGAEVRTQSSAQEALDALNKAMERKDKVRADIGALQNRLENTITNLEIQVEALQASESRISDVDVATEMTEFVRNQVLAQAAVSMLSQANSLPQMALSLLNG